jgi:hypothetical protein
MRGGTTVVVSAPQMGSTVSNVRPTFTLAAKSAARFVVSCTIRPGVVHADTPTAVQIFQHLSGRERRRPRVSTH